MTEIQKIDKREKLKVVTDNGMIMAEELSNLSLNARKLFYLAIAQCRKDDKKFYEYTTTPGELAELWGVSRDDVYKCADAISTELMKIIISVRPENPKAKRFSKYHLFETCIYDDKSQIYFKLHKEMADLLLGLNANYSQPLVWDFMRMKSPYSMAVWHLMQREMRSFKPAMSQAFEFELSLDELRVVTGTENKLEKVSNFKARVLDQAIKEIRKNCGVDISYRNVKHGRCVTGFIFTAKNIWGHSADMPLRVRMKARKAELFRKKKDGTITKEELEELVMLYEDLEQMTMADYDENGQPII